MLTPWQINPHLLEEQINQTNFKHIALDVEAFLEDSNEGRFFTKEFFYKH